MQQKITDNIAKDALDSLVTVKDWLRWGYSQLSKSDCYYGHGTDNPWDEALQLVNFVCEIPGDKNELLLDARLTTGEKEQLVKVFIARVNDKTPAAYLIQQAYFCGLSFYVDERVLVPRSPIAELIESQFSCFIEPQQVNRVLDLCTGSGCIAIACAYAFPGADIDAVDISTDALDVSKINIEQHLLADRVTAIESDGLSTLNNVTYDIIVSNPPYVSQEDWKNLPEEYHAEPELGFVSDNLGLDFTVELLKNAHHYLTDHGILVVEVGLSSDALIEQYPNIPFLWCEFEHGGEGVFVLTKKQLEDIAW